LDDDLLSCRVQLSQGFRQQRIFFVMEADVIDVRYGFLEYPRNVTD